ncbi:hypothetical protein BO99DRAFT_403403 [Aspergillus violaceofuscus CBS 115571]|uniref:WW domain-containing protein n=1 Tax=Aspergillus violaceofuscus (strain CBS 115571) TaxID=1450538 RepID=A0A2V5HQJ1_ASPV1|nr:hypothetical protein BO99DRAFT_403403 [Aspergillus violaceofuscus CBS 115571]
MSATSPQDVPGGGVASPAPETLPRDATQEQVTPSDVSTEGTASRKEEEAAEQAQRQEEDVSGQEAEEGEVEDDSEREEGEEKEAAAAAAAAANQQDTSASAPPLPDEVPPPLPNEVPPGDDDGWEPVWDANAQAYYFYNRLTGVSQWENPRVPGASAPAASAAGAVPIDDNGDGDDDDEDGSIQEQRARVLGGYNPAIHGDYDPTAPYAQQYERQDEAAVAGMDPNQAYEAVGAFNRFTGRWQAASQNPEYHNDENKSKRQMYAFFDVDAAANSHDGRSLRAERSAKKLTKAELKMFKEKRREKKEEKRRAWLRD